MNSKFTPHQEHFLDICRFAFANGASDIHFEPSMPGIKIRNRIDGMLKTLKILNWDIGRLFLEDTRMLLGFDPHTIGAPQDSRFSHPFIKADFRANLMPVKYGEKIVLRVLERDKDFHLENYPLEESPKKYLLNCLQKKQGLIIVSGPTGSGKSTLLYSALGSLDRKSLNICTIEDPIEYELDGINQAEIDTENNLTFATALRAYMRQDPDVLMVGEIRDEETAKATIHAASTGHLVLSTIHANSSEEIISRLKGLGIEQQDLESTLLFASAQRLPKKLCDHCKAYDPESCNVFFQLFPKRDIDFVPSSASGCEKCHFTGVSGRVMLFEYMKRTESSEDNNLITRSSLKKAAFEAVRKGHISMGEAYGQFC